MGMQTGMLTKENLANEFFPGRKSIVTPAIIA
jgi:hypothetical protein